ncbi:hypothetical protein BH11BAC4_BH11BAC4_06660 [soil metagenome]
MFFTLGSFNTLSGMNRLLILSKPAQTIPNIPKHSQTFPNLQLPASSCNFLHKPAQTCIRAFWPSHICSQKGEYEKSRKKNKQPTAKSRSGCDKNNRSLKNVTRNVTEKKQEKNCHSGCSKLNQLKQSL